MIEFGTSVDGGVRGKKDSERDKQRKNEGKNLGKELFLSLHVFSNIHISCPGAKVVTFEM